ncbi:MAG: hypothetical protein J5809_08775 [Selenomonadaceae bacterium]|nr:hypothetical protein [Selenomonadaceae bacterium]
MRKNFFVAAVIAACLIFLTGSANAQLLLCDTSDTGYKTYIDTDSISHGVDQEKGFVGVTVRVVGIRPDGSTILDAVLQYVYDQRSKKLYMRDVTHNFDWREIESGDGPFMWTMEYVMTGTVRERYNGKVR